MKIRAAEIVTEKPAENRVYYTGGTMRGVLRSEHNTDVMYKNLWRA